MPEINCPFRVIAENNPCCTVVAEISLLPLATCQASDVMCERCQTLDVAPQVPNYAVASLVAGAGKRSGNETLEKELLNRMRPFFRKLSQVAKPKCVLRGEEVRQVECKPCQANSLTPVMMPVFGCPMHQECTYFNVGTFPRIQACATCEDRQEELG